ncbi:MAG: hypothetical protein CSB47_02790 [Proteobacteria bacterium]|nr:MAG: hypothetical protein CSB47_02790 [Pseudomonadota bacterium]
MKYLSLCLTAGLLTGCSSVTKFADVTNLVDYSNYKPVKVLEMPEGLEAPEYNKTYLVDVSEKITQKDSVVSSAVPLVDSSLASPSLSQVRIVTRAGELALQVDGDKRVWKHSVDALKAMGMTVNKRDQKLGTIDVRDRSLVSDSRSPIGAFLNRTMGKVNQGKRYKVVVTTEGKSGFIVIRSDAGKTLSAADAKPLLARLRKEYTAP